MILSFLSDSGPVVWFLALCVMGMAIGGLVGIPSTGLSEKKLELNEIEYGIPVLTAEGLAVIDAAVAYVDQLCSFNDIRHPEVIIWRNKLAEAVDVWHNHIS